MDRGRTIAGSETGRGRDRILAGLLIGAAHALGVAALLWLHAAPAPQQVQPPALEVRFVPKAPAPPDPAEDPGPLEIAAPAAPEMRVPLISIARSADTSDVLSASQIAGAASAGEGGGGGGACNMARAVQQALRRDRLVAPAVADARRLGQAILLWNGDWVRSGGQDGKGLAVVRQAVIWEVGFAPKACREERMHGLVLVSLADGRTRFAIGAGEWRWSDLLGLRSVSR